jgi:hypothetical protein
MPVMGSSFAFNWPMVHDGVIRRSEEELSDVIWRGMSPAACMLMLIVEACDVDLIGNGPEYGFRVLDVWADSAIDFEFGSSD